MKVAKYNHQSKVHFALSISVVRSTLSRNVGIFRDVLVDSNTDKGRETGRKGLESHRNILFVCTPRDSITSQLLETIDNDASNFRRILPLFVGKASADIEELASNCHKAS